MWIKDYIKTPFIEFVDVNQEFEGMNAYNHQQLHPYEFDNYLVLPIDNSGIIFNGSIMEAKYKFLDLDFADWSDYFTFERNLERENELYYKILNLTDNSVYTLINRKYGSPPNSVNCVHIDLTKFNSYVELDYIDGINLFDWCKVIENAKEIHTVDTSINYIIDKLSLNSKLELYSRYNPPNYIHIKNIFKTKYNFN